MKACFKAIAALIAALLMGLPIPLFAARVSSPIPTMEITPRPSAKLPLRISQPARTPGTIVPPSTVEIGVKDEYESAGSASFEISFVDGLQDSYGPEESIEFQVEGTSPILIEAKPENGFRVSATISDLSRTSQIKGAAVVFDNEKGHWKVNLTAPQETMTEYEIKILLYCDKEDSGCAEVYGPDAQTEKVLALKVY